MKNLMKSFLVLAVILSTVNGNARETENVKNEEQTVRTAFGFFTPSEPEFLKSYMRIKNALVADKPEQVQRAASELSKRLNKSDLEKEQRKALQISADKLAGIKDLKAQRKIFSELSQQLYEAIQEGTITGNTLYWQHCSMALGQGANWLSYEEQVKNPYMGQRMPGCGSIEEKVVN